MNHTPSCRPADPTAGKTGRNCFHLLVTGPGGRLSGADVGVIADALPYWEETSGLNADRLSIMVANVLLGRVISTLLARFRTDWLGRKILMASSGAVFGLSIPMIVLAHCFGPLGRGRWPKEMGLPERLIQQKLTKRLGWA
jgi:SP family myo-inositol transporter-like MFS transporter 13